MVELRPITLIDPRGKGGRKTIELAERPNIGELKDKRILLYNNTKLDFANYYEIFDTIKKEFENRDIKNFVEVRKTVRGKTSEDLKKLAGEFSEEGFESAVIALADVGVSPASTVLTIEMEKADIPAVCITSPPGTRLVRSVAALRAGNLCLCPIDVYQASTVEEVQEGIRGKMDLIVDFLTLPPERLGEISKIPIDLDSEPPTGTIGISRSIQPSEDEIELGVFMEETLDKFDSLDIGDGLPVVPPTKNRVEMMREYCPFDQEEILAERIGPSGEDITVNDVVVNAVMAGCKPEYVPILITAFSAMSDKRYNLLQSVTTSHPGGDLILVSGPIAEEIGLHGGQGCLGPGFRANATIGRTISLVAINKCRAVPGKADLDCLASQAEYTYCFSELSELTPWRTINEENFDSETTTVYVLKAEPPHDIIDFCTSNANDLIESFVDSATTLGSNNCYITGPLVFVITPDHARIFGKDGWDKEAIRNYVHEKVRWPREKVKGRGLVPVRPAGFDQLDKIPVTRFSEDVQVVVAGGRGGHSCVILPWALRSEGIVKPVRLPDGEFGRKIDDFL